MRKTRLVIASTAAMFVGASVLGFGMFTPAQSASALVVPPQIGGTLASQAAAAVAGGGLESGGAAVAAGAGGTVAGAAVGTAGTVLGSFAGAFMVTAGAVGLLIRATGGSTGGYCSLGVVVGFAYGQTCPPPVNVPPGYVANADTSGAPTSPLVCDGSRCVQLVGYVDFVTAAPYDSSVPVSARVACLKTTGMSAGDSIAWTGDPSFPDYVVSGSVQALGSSLYGHDYSCPADATLQLLRTTNGSSGGSAPPYPYPLTRIGPTTASLAAVTTGSADPGRYFQSEATFLDGTKALGSPSVIFHESDATLPPIPEVPNNGKGLSAFVVREWLADGSSSKVVLDFHASPAYEEGASAYPDCAAGACSPSVWVRGKQCTVGGSAVCADWFYEDEDANQIECKYGPAANPGEYAVPLTECNQLAPYYKPSAPGFADPDGKPQPGTTPDPGTDGGTVPSSSGKDCFGNVYGTFDPLGWVTRPVQCAIQWAFVPTDAEAAFQKVKTAWDATPTVKVAGAIGAWHFQPPGTGCSGIAVSLDWIHRIVPQTPTTMHVAQACPGDPLAPWAGWANLFLTVVVAVSGGLALVRIVAGVVSYDGGAAGGD